MILVVDDEPAMVEVIRSVLQDEGHAVATAPDGLAALEYLRDAPAPCSAILDLMMPRMNGLELRAAMLAEPSMADIPVAIVSAFADGDMAPSARGRRHPEAIPPGRDRRARGTSLLQPVTAHPRPTWPRPPGAPVDHCAGAHADRSSAR